MINQWGYSEAITNGGNFITTLNVAQPLFTGKIRKTGFERVGILNEAIATSLKLAESELQKLITEQYLAAYALQSDIGFYTEAYGYMQEQDSLLRQLVEHGFYSQTEYLSFQVEKQYLDLDLAALQAQFRKALGTLNISCGITDKTEVTLAPPDIQLRNLSSGNSSPFFLRFTLDSLMIDNDRQQIDLQYRPTFGWLADAGIVNNVPKEIYKNFGIGLGLNFTLPIYDGQQKQLNYRKVDFREESRKGYEAFFRNQFDEQLWQLSEELRSSRDMIPKLNKQLELAAMLIRQNRLLLNSGSLPMTDYLISLRNYLTIRNNLRQNEVKIQQIINEINYWKQ